MAFLVFLMKKITQIVFQSIALRFLALTILTIVSFQNCSQIGFNTENSDQNVRNPSASSVASSFSGDSTELLGLALYDKTCSRCHGSFSISNLNGRIVTAEKVVNATNSISSMASLRGSLSSTQLSSLENIFNSTSSQSTQTSTISNFECAAGEAENSNSISMKRLTGSELQKTYKSIIPSSVWANLSSNLYLFPEDKLDGDILNFKQIFSASMVNQISRFNEELANQIVSTSTNISSFFGSCATVSSFSKTCFDTFLNSRGALVYRSAIASDDNSRIWSVASQATEITDKMKIVIQILFNDPRFLYHIEMGEGSANSSGLYKLTSYEIANRISYGMTGGPADSTLWAAAVSNSLKTITDVAMHVDRISQTTGFKDRIVELMKFYIGRGAIGGIPTNADFIAGLNVSNIDVAITNEFNEFIKYVIFVQKGTLRDLFLSQAAFPQTSALASVFNTSVWTSGSPVTAPNHYGLVSKPYFFYNTIPDLKLVQRGRSLRMNMLCSVVPQPSASDLAGRKELTENDLLNLTRRDFIDKATLQGPSCIACHSKMNPIGSVTENYDSLGRYSLTEKIFNSSGVLVAVHPVPTVTKPQIIETDLRSFGNLKEFQEALSDSDTLHKCFTRKSFQFFNRQIENISFDSCNLNKMDTQIKQGKPLLNFFVETFKRPSILYKRSY